MRGRRKASTLNETVAKKRHLVQEVVRGGCSPAVSPDFRWRRGIVRASLPRRERIQQPLRRRVLIAVDPPPDLLAERKPSGPQPRRGFNGPDKLTSYLYSRAYVEVCSVENCRCEQLCTPV